MGGLNPVTAQRQSQLKRSRLGRVEADHEQVWQVLRAEGSGHQRELARVTGLHETKVQFYLSFLERAGYLWLEPGRRARRYWLINDTGEVAPKRLRGGHGVLDGNSGETYDVKEFIQRWPGEPAAADSMEQKSWLAMRMLRTFTVSELVMVTELDASKVERRVKALLTFHYLRSTEPSGGEAGYLLPQYRNTGPKAPAISQTLGKLYDYNSKDVIHLEG